MSVSETDRPVAAMPEMRHLSRTALFACAPVVVVACLLMKLSFALGIVYGYGTCVVLYAFLRAYVGYAVEILAAPGTGASRPGNSPAARAQFLAMFLGKFIVLGGILYILLVVLKGNIAGFLTGFVVSQIAMTVIGYKHLNRLSRG
jgi:hypothetical protein